MKKTFEEVINWIGTQNKTDKHNLEKMADYGYQLSRMKDTVSKAWEKWRRKMIDYADGTNTTIGTENGITVRIAHGNRYEYGTPAELIKLLEKEGKTHLLDHLLKVNTGKLKAMLGEETLREYDFVQTFPQEGAPTIRFSKHPNQGIAESVTE